MAVGASQLLGRLRQENCLNLEGGGCSELRSDRCTLAWVTRAKLHLKKKENKQMTAIWILPTYYLSSNN